MTPARRPGQAPARRPGRAVPVLLRESPWGDDPGEEVRLELAPGASLAEAVDAALEGAVGPEAARAIILAEIDGRPVPAELWTETPVPAAGGLSFALLPRGSALRTVAQIAIVVAAAWVGGPVGAAIAIGGSLALNVLFPPPTPSLPNFGTVDPAGPERWAAAQAVNRRRLYGTRTLVLGEVRFAPDLVTRQILVPTALDDSDPPAASDHTATIPGAAETGTEPRVDRVAVLDLGIGALSLGRDPDGAATDPVTVQAARRWVPAHAFVEADSSWIAAEYAAAPGAALAPPAGLRDSAGWPLRARAVADEPAPLSGATAEIDSTRRATRLVCIVGGSLYDSSSSGALTERSTAIAFDGDPPAGGAGQSHSIAVRNDTLSPEYVAVVLAGGALDWRAAGGDREASARSRTDLSIAQSCWLAPEADLAGRTLPSTILGVRLAGHVGAAARKTLRVTATQTVPVPDANGVWGAPARTRNPAAILRAFALGWFDGGDPVAGTGRPRDTIDHANLARFYRYCEAHDPPFRCDLLLQGDTRRAEDVERLIAATARAEISWAGGRFGVVWAEPDDAPRGLVAPANALPGAASMSWRPGRPPGEIVASYRNRETWDAADVRVAVPGGAAGRERRIRLEGVTEPVLARFHAAAIAGEEAFHRRLVSWRAGPEGARMPRGSLWWMGEDAISGGLSGRLRELGPARVRLDRPARSGARLWLAVDVPGRPLHRTQAAAAAGTPPGGETDRFDLVTPFPALDAAASSRPREAIWRLYDHDRPPLAVRVVANRPLSETGFEIVARDESAAFWTFLDDYRDAPAAPPAAGVLPEHVEITEDGEWSWPQAWTAAGIVDASLILRGAGGGGQGGGGITELPDDGKGGGGTSYFKGGSGRTGGTSTVTLADGTKVVALGGAGGPRSNTHNGLGEPGGRGGSGYSGGVPSHLYPLGGWSGRPGERVNRLVAAADAPLRIDLGAGGRGGSGAAGQTESGNPGTAGRPARVLIYPLPP